MRINHSAAGLLSLACLALAACRGLPTSLDSTTGSPAANAPAQVASPASASAIISLTNQTRSSSGLSPLSENAALDHAAAILCSEIAQTGVWSHVQTGTTYPNPQDRATAVGYVWRALGENLAGTTTADAQHVFRAALAARALFETTGEGHWLSTAREHASVYPRSVLGQYVES